MTDKPDSKPAAKPVAAKPAAKPPTPATKAAVAAAKPATTKPAVAAKPAAAKPVAAKPVAAKPAAKPAAAAKTNAAKKPAANPQKDALVAAVKKTEAVKPAAKVAAKPVAKTAAKPVAKPVKVEKPKKPKLVRDSFTIPEGEYAQLATLKKRLLALGVAAKKGEIMRAGLALLAAQKDAELSAELKKVTPLKTGRPAK